jgi:hypothetical protein
MMGDGLHTISATRWSRLAERDFDRLWSVAPDVRMRADPAWPLSTFWGEPAAARFATWSGIDGFELVHSGSNEVGDRLHVFTGSG